MASGVIPADYTITNDAEWDSAGWPAGLAANGGIIDVAGGAYTVKTITHTPSAPLIFRKRAGDSDPPQVRLIANACSNIVFEDFEFFSSSWEEDPDPCVGRFGLCDLTFTRCHFQGNYRGNRTFSYDPAIPLPEMNGIYGVVSGGSITFSTVHSIYGYDAKNIGDLLADGTGYSAYIIAAGGTGASCTFDVSGGNITITAQSAGSGYTSNLETKTVRLPDGSGGYLHPLVALMPYGIQDLDSTGTSSNLVVQDCTFDFLQSAIKCRFTNVGVGSGTTEILRNNFDRILCDTIASGSGTQGLRDVTIRGNVIMRHTGRKKYLGDGHGDVIQFWALDATANGTNVVIEGNIAFIGAATGAPQGMLIQDIPTELYHNFRIAGNVMLNDGSWTIYISKPSACYVGRNTALLYDVTDYSTTADIELGDAGGEPSVIEYNLTEGVASGANDLEYNNLEITAHNSAAYTAVLADPHSLPTTAAEVRTAFAHLSDNRGALITGYVDWTTGEVDRTFENTYVRWPSQVNAALSDSIESGWYMCLNSGPLTGRTFTVNTGTLWEADDAAGTGATQLTSPFSLTPGKYYEARHTASASNGTQVTQTFTASDGSASLSFDSTTVATAPEWKGRYGTDSSVTAGNNRQDTVDIGAPHDDRVVCIVTATGSNFIQNSGDVLLGGNTTTRQLGTNLSTFQVHTIAVGQAGGATSMTLQVNNTSAGSFARCWSEVYVIYPSGGSATPLDAKTAAASGTSTATTAAITIAAGGYLIVFGGYTGSANPVVPTYSGTDTLNEDDDWVSEAATPMWAGHVDVTESTTRTVSTPSNGTSASKTAIGVSWAAPA